MNKLHFLLLIFFVSCNSPNCDIVIQNGTVIDGTGSPRFIGTVAITNDKIVYVGPKKNFSAEKTIDANNKIVSPGFINMLSWGYNTLLEDGRSLSDLKQGVTLEVFGEGNSPGPVGKIGGEDFIGFGDAMEKLVKNGVSPNIASFLGATNVRKLTVGYENRDATDVELKDMEQIVETGMKEGALGIGSSLIYAPADYANTNELITICKVASKFKGKYISHMRNEGRNVLEALDELITISKEANIPAEIYHLKASRKPNWFLLDSIINRVEKARENGLKITADVYTYPASSTGLTGVIPTWVQEGGHRAWIERMKSKKVRKRLLKDIRKELSEQPPDGILMVGFKNDSLDKIYRGKTIAEASSMRNQSPEETIIDLVIEDDSRIQCVYYSMSEENLRKKISLPWVSFCSDAGSYSDIEKDFRTHPRAFGSFIRVIGKFSRDEGVITLEEAIRKLSGFPAKTLELDRRGTIENENFADIVIFEPKKVRDLATFNEPLQFAEGVETVLVNGQVVLESGEHTGIFPGRFVKGIGKGL